AQMRRPAGEHDPRVAVLIEQRHEHRRGPGVGHGEGRGRTGAPSVQRRPDKVEVDPGGQDVHSGPRRGTTGTGAGGAGDALGTAPRAHDWAAFAATRLSSSSRSPAVFRLLMTRPGGVSPRSHSIQYASSFDGSGGGRS